MAEQGQGNGETLEQALTRKAWSDAAFREQLQADPSAALRTLGVEVPAGVKLAVHVQQRNALYYLIPPPATGDEDANRPINQMDFWESEGAFCWVVPEKQKVALLQLRQAFRGGKS